MPDTLVINASPLIFLGNAGLLDLLRAGGATRFVVPSAVLDEVTKSQHTDASARLVAQATWIERAPTAPIPQAIIEWDLGPGESAVIATCLELRDAVPVIDDLAGRKCARSFRLQVIGTIGVVIAAHRVGQINDPRKVLHVLRESGMWISDRVIENALRLAGVN
jgi:predicted nucleic acid-binding protein